MLQQQQQLLLNEFNIVAPRPQKIKNAVLKFKIANN